MNKFLTALASTTVVFLWTLCAAAQETQLYWGDTHLHTKLSGDAYVMQNRSLGPNEAYRYAKGLPVVNAKTRHKIQIGTPLDFLVVADHAEYVGVIAKLFEGDPELVKTKNGKIISDLVAQGKEREAFFNRHFPYGSLNRGILASNGISM
jgi:hypothetical protein